MSSDNGITINKKTFEVREVFGDEWRYGTIIAKGKNLKDAVEIAEEYMIENLVEYGIRFIE